jgi:hypothetical protein
MNRIQPSRPFIYSGSSPCLLPLMLPVDQKYGPTDFHVAKTFERHILSFWHGSFSNYVANPTSISQASVKESSLPPTLPYPRSPGPRLARVQLHSGYLPWCCRDITSQQCPVNPVVDCSARRTTRRQIVYSKFSIISLLRSR